MSRNLEESISQESGIQSTKDLEKYLGMPVLQKRINKDTFGEVLERVASRLSGWKERCLSFAGRLTLTKVVLASIPVHTMSTIALPKSTLNSLDKMSRSFLWGSNSERRKQHLLEWKKVCRPKYDGGLGIRSATEMNKALLAKLGWRLLQDHESLWARVFRNKYRVKELHDVSWLVKKSHWSSTWRNMAMELREVVVSGAGWVVGDGKSTRFWSDKWLEGKTLMEMASNEIRAAFRELRVHELWRDGTGWIFDQIEPYVSATCILKLRAVVLDNVTGVRDRLSWVGTPDGKFTVRSAYEILTRDSTPRANLTCLFSRIWRVIAPERVRTFLWLGMHQVIMTNMERHRRHLCDSSLCQVCKGGDESIPHIFRDCPAMRGVWERLVPRRKRREFFTMSLLEWLYHNLGDEENLGDSTWATLFAVSVWWGWKWRCVMCLELMGNAEIEFSS